MSFARHLRPLSPKGSENTACCARNCRRILSPDDRQKDLDEKRGVYFAWGITLEIIADPEARNVDFYDSAEHFERVDAMVEAYTPASVPSLTLALRAIFGELDIPEELR